MQGLPILGPMALTLRYKDEAATLKSQLEQLQSELATERDGRAADVSKALQTQRVKDLKFLRA